MAEIRLPDLEVIRAYSIAVRREKVDAAEVAELLRRDLAFVQAAAAAKPKPKPAGARGTATAKGR
ncbi:MAG: hypothetical protein WDA71_06290 [Actinomycetota bacterium]